MDAVILAVLLLLVALLLLSAYVFRLRRERLLLEHELRRVLRAGAEKVESQHVELSWRRSLCETLPLAVLVTDEEKRILYGNPAAERLFGRVVTGESAIFRLRNHILEGLLDMAMGAEEGSNGAIPHPVELPGDQQFLVMAHAWPMAGGRHGAFLILQEVTELNRLSRARRDMAANLSHELRTPLASVRLLAETLLNDALSEPEMARRFVERIASENEALIRLVEDLTTLAGIESGRTPIRLERTDLRSLVEQRLQRLAPQADQKAIRFELVGPEAAQVLLDPERFGQVLTNLLDNAIKFSPTGGLITIAIESTDQSVTLSIRDEGPGIPPQELSRIWERFYKGDRARTRSGASGTGLGLAIVKHLVEVHGGSIYAESQFGHGATFRVVLPND